MAEDPWIQVADEDVANIFDARPTEDPKLVTTYLDRIATRGRFRRASAYVRDVLTRLEQAEAEGDASGIDNAIAKVQRVAFDLDRLAHLTCELKDEAESLGAFLLHLEARRSDRRFTGLETGFEHTNHVTNGLGRGLYILAGPPSCGKTTLAKRLADQVADNKGVPVLIYSYEQSGEDFKVGNSGVHTAGSINGSAPTRAYTIVAMSVCVCSLSEQRRSWSVPTFHSTSGFTACICL